MNLHFVTGTLSVTYLVSFVAVKASKWGFHLNFQGVDIPNDLHNIYIPGKFVGFFSTCIYWECFPGEDKVPAAPVNFKNSRNGTALFQISGGPSRP